MDSWSFYFYPILSWFCSIEAHISIKSNVRKIVSNKKGREWKLLPLLILPGLTISLLLKRLCLTHLTINSRKIRKKKKLNAGCEIAHKMENIIKNEKWEEKITFRCACRLLPNIVCICWVLQPIPIHSMLYYVLHKIPFYLQE